MRRLVDFLCPDTCSIPTRGEMLFRSSARCSARAAWGKRSTFPHRCFAADRLWPLCGVPIFPGNFKKLAGHVGEKEYADVVRGTKSLVPDITIRYEGPVANQHYEYCQKGAVRSIP